jgi:hypothetical protein
VSENFIFFILSGFVVDLSKRTDLCLCLPFRDVFEQSAEKDPVHNIVLVTSWGGLASTFYPPSVHLGSAGPAGVERSGRDDDPAQRKLRNTCAGDTFSGLGNQQSRISMISVTVPSMNVRTLEPVISPVTEEQRFTVGHSGNSCINQSWAWWFFTDKAGNGRWSGAFEPPASPSSFHPSWTLAAFQLPSAARFKA